MRVFLVCSNRFAVFLCAAAIIVANMCIQPDGSNSGAPIILWTCNGGDIQSWAFEPAPDTNPAQYSIVNKATGLCLNVPDSSLSMEVQLIQYPYVPGATNAQWELQEAGGGNYYIRNENSGLVINVWYKIYQDGTKIQQFYNTNDDNEKFWIDPGKPAFGRYIGV